MLGSVGEALVKMKLRVSIAVAVVLLSIILPSFLAVK